MSNQNRAAKTATESCGFVRPILFVVQVFASRDMRIIQKTAPSHDDDDDDDDDDDTAGNFKVMRRYLKKWNVPQPPPSPGEHGELDKR